MTTYETVTVLVVAGTLIVGLIDYLRAGGPIAQLGRQGAFWFEHSEDRPLDQHPSEDRADAPIPRRPLRGRLR